MIIGIYLIRNKDAYEFMNRLNMLYFHPFYLRQIYNFIQNILVVPQIPKAARHKIFK